MAHGLGGSTDLPIPLTYVLIGAAWALTFTFAVVALAWRRPRFVPDKPGRPLPRWVTTLVDAPVTRWAMAIAALPFAVWVAITALFDPQDARNPLPGVFYVLLWVGLVALSLAVRPVWRAISPVRTLHRLLGRRSLGLRYPEWAGYWPAAVGLLAFVWLELASPDPGSLGAIKIRGVQHGGISAVGAAPQPRRPPGDRQPVRPPAVAAGARRHCRGAGGAVGIDRVRQHYVLSMHPSVLASIKVAGVVAGHIAAVIAAHDRASRLLPAGHQLTRQLAMMLVMVGYTFTGLYLLFGG